MKVNAELSFNGYFSLSEETTLPVFFNRFFLSWAFGQKNLMISFVYEQTVTSLTCCSFFCAVGCQNVRPNGHREKATYEKQFGPLICMKNF